MFEPVGLPITNPLIKPHFFIQLDAGYLYHSERKHWANQQLLIEFANKLCDKYNLICYVQCPDNTFQGTDKLINAHSLGLQSISIMKEALFSIGLTGFFPILSLMLNRPTIYKFYNQDVDTAVFGHPDWQNRKLSIQELSEDINPIKDYIHEVISLKT